MTPFTRFVGIDWTGAKGTRHRSIAVAECGLDAAPALVRPGHVWSRAEVLTYVQDLAKTRALVGFDFSFGFPHHDRGSYFPGEANPPNARALWAEVDAAAAHEPDLGGLSHITRRRAHYWLGAADGPRARAARLRVVEERQRAAIAGPPSSVFVLLGAAQCGKASLSGMRLLHALRDSVAVWPFDPPPDNGAMVVEIYCRVFAAWGGVRGKIRDRATLNVALAQLGSPPADVPPVFYDHVGDALITAAGMRAAAAHPALWHPPGLDTVSATEGWTYGIG